MLHVLQDLHDFVLLLLVRKRLECVLELLDRDLTVLVGVDGVEEVLQLYDALSVHLRRNEVQCELYMNRF